MSTTVMWFRRDLRLSDDPALLAAAGREEPAAVVPLFVLDPALWGPAGPSRRAYLRANLADLGERTGGLLIRRGDPVAEVLATAGPPGPPRCTWAPTSDPTAAAATRPSRRLGRPRHHVGPYRLALRGRAGAALYRGR